ncbi:helix-turn-helix domain-containing protein [Clostridium oryzae]|uniref:helix-turn-helix domain-containing protein n=1 Tax=Clostridium oryzae TaxID=1450648 RepID=UPI0011176EB2|nr:helix-turn-helix transcriptional regulator [Clostridium oryzae]
MSIFLAVVYYLRKFLQYSGMSCNTLAERLKKARMMTGMSQVELAKKIGISRSVLNVTVKKSPYIFLEKILIN